MTLIIVIYHRAIGMVEPFKLTSGVPSRAFRQQVNKIWGFTADAKIGTARLNSILPTTMTDQNSFHEPNKLSVDNSSLTHATPVQPQHSIETMNV